MTIAKAIARAWTDAAYKTKLVSDPHAALSEVGVSIPTGTTVKVIEAPADTAHVVLGVAPDAAFKTKLVSDPHGALSKAGVSVPTGRSVKVHEDTADTTHVLLPDAPAKASEMSIDELEKVTGAGVCMIDGVAQMCPPGL